MFKFDWIYLILLLPLPLITHWLKRRTIHNNNSIYLPFALDLKNLNTKHKKYKNTLLWLAWAFLIIASMRPIFVDKAIKLPIKGRDIIMAVDLSGSMQEKDFTINGQVVNRLNVVKIAALKFITARNKDRIALIVFGSNAFLYSPLTFDKELIKKYLSQVQINMAGENTAISDVIILAAKHFSDNNNHTQKTLILLTDGKDTASKIPIQQAITVAKEQKMKIYTIGLGSNTANWFNLSSPLDEDLLKDIALQTGGLYFHAKDTKSLHNIYQELDKLEYSAKEDMLYRPQKDLFYYPLGIFLILIIIFILRKCR